MDMNYSLTATPGVSLEPHERITSLAQASAVYGEIQSELAKVKDFFVKRAFALGEFLTREKDRVKQNGNWTEWASEYLPFNIRTAQRFMTVYKNATRMSFLSLDDAYNSAFPPQHRSSQKSKTAMNAKQVHAAQVSGVKQAATNQAAVDAIRDFTDDDVVSALLARISLDALMRVIQRQT
jgi:Protein of unknown function (DUF3102)